MEVTAYKCSECKFLTDDIAKYNKHILDHLSEKEIEIKFPSIDDPDCKFANGEYFVQRDIVWLNSYKELIEKIAEKLKIGYEPWSYGWFRVLDDGRSFLYGPALRYLQVCPACFREWGQQYYANNCKHGK